MKNKIINNKEINVYVVEVNIFPSPNYFGLLNISAWNSIDFNKKYDQKQIV